MKIRIQQDSQAIVATIGIQGPAGPAGSQGENGLATLAGASDVDFSTLIDGSVLVYEQQSQKWKSTTLLNQQAIDAGEF